MLLWTKTPSLRTVSTRFIIVSNHALDQILISRYRIVGAGYYVLRYVRDIPPDLCHPELRQSGTANKQIL